MGLFNIHSMQYDNELHSLCIHIDSILPIHGVSYEHTSPRPILVNYQTDRVTICQAGDRLSHRTRSPHDSAIFKEAA